MADAHSNDLFVRACCRCKQEKSLEEFHRRPDRPGGRHYHCKACESNSCKTPHRRAQGNKRAAEFRARLKEADYEEFRRRERQSNFRRLYGISIEDYDAMLAAQGGLCAICGEAGAGGRWKRRLHVDHAHDTGAIRGLLCHGCNVAIGSLRESPALLLKAVEYLKRYGKA
jgi:hypothetical protein